MFEWDSDLSKVKTDDYIATIQFGWVKVINIDKNSPYSIVTKYQAYIKDGKRQVGEIAPSAFIKPPKWLEEIIGTKPCEFKKDELVLVSNDGFYWTKRYFSKYIENKYYCFKQGRTSKTAIDSNDISAWIYCKKFE
jgi:hypothetical protein